jgi:NAD(P)-dependent dehydrogenase (short-subunit alcohol dehydrogenase family)
MGSFPLISTDGVAAESRTSESLAIPASEEDIIPDDRIAVIAGVGKDGIGQAIAQRLSDEDYTLVLADCNEEAGLQTTETLRRQGRPVTFVAGDLADERTAVRVMSEVGRWTRTGRLDVLINNAGSAQDPGQDNLMELTPEKLHKYLADNVTGAVNMTRWALERFMLPKRKGAMVCIGSMNGQLGMGIRGQLGYGIAKCGLTALVSNVATQFGPRGIRAVLVRPGLIVTGSRNWLRRLREDPDWARLEGYQTPARRLGRPEDVANAVAWLVSDQASYINGIELPVDGGMSASGILSPVWDPADFRGSYVRAIRDRLDPARQEAA